MQEASHSANDENEYQLVSKLFLSTPVLTISLLQLNNKSKFPTVQ